jgi:glycosyltransferase involved in cell wall biosynthesis
MKTNSIHIVLHITNTDIAVDSRILKEFGALSEIENLKLVGIGVNNKACSRCEDTNYGTYRPMHLFSSRLLKFGKAVQYFFELIEFTLKVICACKNLRPTVVHCHDTFALPAAWAIKLIHSCKLVYDAHELESDKNGQSFLLSRATLLIERLCWSRIDVLISVSDSIIDWYQQELGRKSSVLVLNAPVVSAQPASAKIVVDSGNRYFHRRYALHNDDLVFVYLGNLGPGRGIEMCLDAFESGPYNAHVVFIGHGTLEPQILEFANRHANIHIHAAVPHDEVVALVASADYGLCLVENVSLSDYYCLPNKLFEYCFASVPVLASKFPEISELVETFSLGMCCNPDSASVRQALLDIVANPPKFAPQDISSLSWDAQARRLVDVYQRQLLNHCADKELSTNR